ncbi:MAG: 3-phosphoshikimate 1-carboxyvinyltransferase [Thermodesulfobacteriota bacterium]|nr:3-phosphoshikimate 1-carboxyvinyltransferase [Thermodesulfobacteriota bacterium]
MKVRQIKPKPLNSSILVSVPGSKSISHRILICAALAEGESIINNLLYSEDIRFTMSALSKMGALIREKKPGVFTVKGFNGQPRPFSDPIYLGNSGTSMRLVAGVAGLGRSPYILTGDDRMQQRPMKDLLTALDSAGIKAETLKGGSSPPVRIQGGALTGGPVCLDCSKSSQYLSSLLMAGPFFEEGLTISLPFAAVSAPYIDLTMDVMAQFNVSASRINELKYQVPGKQTYCPGEFSVEPDISNASYFWAAGAVSGKMVSVAGINKNSLQGDIRFLDILEQMGCLIDVRENSTGVKGGFLNGVDVDMSDIPDVVPTLAVVAAFARGKTMIRNIAHLKNKESNRIDAVVSQLGKMGIEADQGEDWLSVTGGRPLGAVIETFNDHRIAMAFAVAGLMVEKVEIENPGCVAKSFPGFWEIFDEL